MLSTFHIGFDSPLLNTLGTSNGADVFPTLAQAVERLTQAAHEQWTRYALGAPLPDGGVITARSGEYARSIMLRRLGDFAGEVFSELPYADAIEQGRPARDLHDLLHSSLKVRISKAGKRYLIVPFRFGTPGTSMGGNVMPDAVHQWWQGKEASHVTGAKTRLYGARSWESMAPLSHPLLSDRRTRAPLTVAARTYHWGARLDAGTLAALGIHGQQQKRMAGMTNFKVPGAEGGASHSGFITFRVMVEGSPGWRVPAQPGRHPARAVSEVLQPVAEAAFKAALEEDVRRMLGAE